MASQLEDLHKAIMDEDLQRALLRASTNNQVKVDKLLSENPWLRELAREVKRVKEESIRRLEDLIDQAINSLKRINVEPHYAETGEEARRIITGIIGSGKTVVMSKSMAAEEAGVREALEEAGNTVWETDLGQLLVQLEGGKPMHTIAPAVHMTREKALRLVRERLGEDLPQDAGIEEIAGAVRRFLRDKILKADAGISGANALAADTGAIVLVENEGNIRLVTGAPPLHIAIVPVDKIVPTLLDAVKVAMVQAAYAGLYPPTYINIIAGPSSTADIEQVRVWGAQGPREVHVVLLDNGRLNARSTMLGDQLRCVRCGRCQFECPVWIHTANTWGGPVYGGPMGINWTAITHSMEEASRLAYLCLGCGRCDEVCPVEIPISRILHWLKTRRQHYKPR
ncbi:MAG: lactate utilization protein [Desulfurococcales archaeon]|nr:lactate utilization protein [Desulfurococcales archaeon]